MGTKLMKHEYLRTRSGMGLILGASIAMVVVGTLLGKTGWPFIAQLGILMAIVAIIAVLPVSQFFLAVDYWRNSYRRTGYFTQTLPIAGGIIFKAKLVWGIMMSLIAGLLCGALLLFFMRFGAASLGVDGGQLFEQIGLIWQGMLDTWPWWLLIVALLMLGALVISNLVLFYFAATIGSQEPLNRHGIGGPILVGVVAYMAQQGLFMVAIIALPFGIQIVGGAPQVVTVNWLKAMQNNTDLAAMPTGFLAVFLILPILMTVWSYRSWSNKISLA